MNSIREYCGSEEAARLGWLRLTGGIWSQLPGATMTVAIGGSAHIPVAADCPLLQASGRLPR